MKKQVIYFFRYILYWILYILGKILSRILNRIKVSGRENISTKSEGNCYFSNHVSIPDSWWILLAMMNIPRMLISQKNIPVNAADSKNFFSHPIWKHFFKLMKCIPVNRNSKNLFVINKQVDEYKKVLNKQNLLLFFEGTRSKNGEIGECKYGPAKLVLEAPYVKYRPIFLKGVEKIMPIKEGKIFSRLSFFHKGQITFGPEIDFSDIFEKEIEEKEKLELIKKRVKNSVLALQP